MPFQLAYQELLEDYRKLQLRITQFSTVEQQLINANDRLDQELLIYKRISEFNAGALQCSSIDDLLHRAAEFTIGIFEVEAAFIFVVFRQNDDLTFHTGSENFSTQEIDFHELYQELLEHIDCDLDSPITGPTLKQTKWFNQYASAVCIKNRNADIDTWVIGLISEKNELTYNRLEKRHQTIFSVFGHQVNALIENLHQSRKLNERNVELMKSNSELDQFVYSVSHDLRSPLLAVKGIIHLITQTEEVNETISSYLAMAESSVNKLDKNIQEILEYSRNSRIEVAPDEISLPALIKDIFHDLQYSNDKEIDFQLVTNNVDLVTLDKFRVIVILKNLIGNAVKYSKDDDPNPRVDVDLSRDDHNLQIQIKDHGIGIPKEAQEHIFKMFYRGTSKSIGTGLGLYICKEMINKLEGTITVDSTENIGSQFTIELPIPAAD